MAPVDLVIVGAGPFGLIAAHTWLELHPSDNVIIIERGPDLGGVWSQSRVYQTMMTQSPVGMIEYSCYPMEKLPKNETFYDLFSASHVTTYLENFAVHKSFNGKTIKDRIVFDSPVKRVAKISDSWSVETVSGEMIQCKKLILATGVTSIPNIPFSPSKGFTPRIVHTLDLAAQTPLIASPSVKSVVVIGGAKSAFDAVCLLHSLGKSITWIIRTSGQGPGLLSAPDAPWPLSNSHEIISTRLISKMNPCIFEPLDNWGRFFHGNVIGQWLVDKMWSSVDSMWRTAANYGRDENMKALNPDRPVYWSSDGIGVHNSESMWDLVSNATVLRENVESLEGSEVILASGKKIPCDMVVAATGWLNGYPMFDEKMAIQLGLPRPADQDNIQDLKWEKLLASADAKVVETFPRLSIQPEFPERKPKSTPTRLYRAMIPTQHDEDQSIAFMGTVGTTQNFIVAEVQALWIATYFSKKLSLPSQDGMETDVALATAWRRRRYLADGYTFIFEQLQYTSMLLRDLGLNDLRKGGGWREILSPYMSADYRGILDEWRAKHHVAVDGK